MTKRVLIIAAHPDDEILGCGGAMARHVKAGDMVSTVIVAEGLTSRDETRDADGRKEELSDLADTARKANAIVGVDDVTLVGLPDNRLDSLDRLDLVKVVEKQVQRVRPSIIYTHHRGDVNIDHNCLHAAVVTACRPMPGGHRVERLLFYEVASSTEWQTPASERGFEPNWFVDIEATLALKLEALKAYDSEMRDWPHARSVKALEYLARWRGANIGVEAAEAFELGRQLELKNTGSVK